MTTNAAGVHNKTDPEIGYNSFADGGGTSSSSSSTENKNVGSSQYYFPTINLIAFTVNVLLTYGIGVGGFIDSLPTNTELSAKYQTLVTPAGVAFSIWSIIFLFQFIYAVQQFCRPDIVPIGYKYVWVVIAQCAWTIFFSQEWITASCIAMYTILFTLGRIVAVNYQATPTIETTTNGRIVRYILEEFPFTIHFGWICVASVVNTNVVLISWDMNNANVEYYFALVSLYLVLTAALLCIVRFGFITIPLIHAWGLYFIHSLLRNETPASILARYTENQISMIDNTSYYISLAIVVMIGLSAIYKLFKAFRPTK